MDRTHLARLAQGLIVGAFGILLAACGGPDSTSASPTSTGGGTTGGTTTGGGGTTGGTTTGGIPIGGTTGGTTTGGGLPSATYTISWSQVFDTNVTGYRIYFSNKAIGTGVVRSVNVASATTTSVDVQPSANGIPVGQTLFVVVSSTGASGLESPISSPVSVVVAQ
jgi:hypothetical protein